MSAAPADSERWSVADVMRYTGMKESTVLALVRRGEIPCWHEGQRLVFIAKRIRAWWEARA